ncbi:MAG: ribonuclease D [Gammaproteobacteria bacterium]|jgi:ribonuclease D|nr:MAG: ribonuclease D [Gammaproteobacteria bacterium]
MSGHTHNGFEIQLIESESTLAAACRELAGHDWVAVDTEFERTCTYYPELCLTQIAAGHKVFLVDPLKLKAMTPLEDLLFDPRVTKVFHAARQDLEIFHNLYGKVPVPVFDTQIAGQLLGLPAQSSYAGMVKNLLGIDLEKAHTRTDWKRRPLSPGQLRYAAEDVYYLARIYESVRQRLSEAGMLAWLADDFAALADPTLYAVDPYVCWKKLRPAKRLPPDEIPLLRELAAWREIAARMENLPRNWVLSDAVMLSLLKLRPRTPEALSAVPGLNARFVAKHGQTLLSAMNKPAPAIVVEPEWVEQRSVLNPAQRQLVDRMDELVKRKEKLYNLAENIIVTRKGLETLVRTGTHAQLLHGWRQHLAGRELLGLLNESQAVAATDSLSNC